MKKLSRREFLRLATLGMSAVATAPVLSGCNRQQPSPAAASTIQAEAALPTRTPLPAADVPAEAQLTATLAPAPARPLQVGASIVSVVQSPRSKASDLTYDDIREMVQSAVDLSGGLQDVIKDRQTVVLKPNLYGKVYQVSGEPVSAEVSGLVTDWRVTRATVELVRKLNPSGKVYVMEGSCIGPTDEIMQHLKYTPENIPGVDAFIGIEADSGDWQDFESSSLAKVTMPDGLWTTEYYLNRKYKEADVVISLPVMKNHSYAAVSGAIKNVAIGASPANIYGKSASDDNRFNSIPHDKVNFHNWVHDYYRCRPVDFSIVDGLQGIQNGPMCYSDRCDLPANQMNMRLILAGRDAVAVDTIQSLVMSWDPESIKYLKLLNGSATGNLDTAHITVAGMQVDQVRKEFAGSSPQCGGFKVFTKDAPSLSIEKASAASGKLSLLLAVGEKTNKVEVFIDDELLGKVSAVDYRSLEMDASNISSGSHTLKVWAYDRFLNRSEQVQKIDF